MSETKTGTVGYLGYKIFQKKKFWSFALEEEDGVYYRTGVVEPDFAKGDVIEFQFDVVKNGKYINNEVITDTIKTVGSVAKEVSAKKASSGSKRGAASKDEYWSNKEILDQQRLIFETKKQQVISYQAAVNSALAIVSKAVDLELIKLPKTGNKGYDVFVEAVDREALRLFNLYINAPEIIDNNNTEGEEDSVDTGAAGSRISDD